MNKKRINFSTVLPFLAVIIVPMIISSCREDDEPAAVIAADNSPVNDWILENMQQWYFWQDQLPQSPDKSLAPDQFFESLLSTQDRFSWIEEDYAELLNSLNGITKEAGFEYVLYREGSTQNVLVQVLFVKPGSPAQSAGIKRGDVITRINGETPTVDNYRSALAHFADDHYTIVLKPIVADEKRFDVEQTISLSTLAYAEDPNHLNKVFQVNGKKIGYYVYNFFASGTEQDPQKYDLEMDDVFAGFKAQGVSDLILDLRFNSGGSETSATNLASLISPGANSSKVFFKKEYNNNIQSQILADPTAGPSLLERRLISKSGNIGNALSGRVYVLTSSRTASASELVINGLKPYMDVFLIGDVTYGKNVGSISLYDEEDPANKWGMQPIVLKVYNSQGESDYDGGFMPNIEHKDNDLFIYPLGDVREALLADAIAQVTGVPIVARKGDGVSSRKAIGYSLDKKKRSFVLNMDAVMLK